MSIQFLTDLEVLKLRQDVIRAEEGLRDYYLGTASGVKGTEPRLGVPEVDRRVQELFSSLRADFTKLITEDGLFFIVTEQLEIIMTEGQNG